MPSQTPEPVTTDRTTATRAITRPTSAPESSSSSTGSSGAFERRMNSGHDAPRRSGFDSRTAVRNDDASSTIATRRMATAHCGDSSSCGWRSFSTPSKMANMEPSANSTIDTTKAQK